MSFKVLDWADTGGPLSMFRPTTALHLLSASEWQREADSSIATTFLPLSASLLVCVRCSLPSSWVARVVGFGLEATDDGWAFSLCGRKG